MFRRIALKIHNINTIDTFSWLRDLEVMHRTVVPEVPRSITGSDKKLRVSSLFCCGSDFIYFGAKSII